MRLHARVSRVRDDRPRPERVLVAVDFGAPSLAAARWVAGQLLPDAQLVLAHVLPVPRPPAFLAGHLRPSDDFVREVAGPMRGGLEGLAVSLGARHVRIELRVGEPATQLAALAAEVGADLVCVGRTSHRGETVRLGRNTVDRLLRRLDVPLLQATGAPDGAPANVMAAVDGGAASDAVLRLGVAIAARLEARLTALHVLDEDVRAYVRAMEVSVGAAADAPAAEEALWGATASWLTGALAAAGARPGRAHAMVGRGDPGAELLGASRRSGTDLLVIGRSGRDALSPDAVGSTTRLVLRAAPCPVLVVPDLRAPAGPTNDGTRGRGCVTSSVVAALPAPRPGRGDGGRHTGDGLPPAAGVPA